MKEGYSLFHPNATFGNVGAGSVAIKRGEGNLTPEIAREQMLLWLHLLNGNLLREDLPVPEMMIAFLANGKTSEVILSIAETLQTFVQVGKLDDHTKQELLECLSQIKAQIEEA